MLVPEAYQNHPTLSARYPEAVAFYEYYKGQMEAWDGPALLVFRYGALQARVPRAGVCLGTIKEPSAYTEAVAYHRC